MRKTLSRIGVVGATVALTTVMLPAGTASAFSSASCDPLTSKKLLTTPILESEDNRLWVDVQSPARALVCFDFPFLSVGSGVIVVDAASGGTLPSVTTGNDPSDCGFELVSPSDPVSFRIAVDVPTAAVCFTVGGETLTLAFSQGAVGTPKIEVWRDGTFSWLDVAACPVEYVLWQVGGGPDTCMTTNTRML